MDISYLYRQWKINENHLPPVTGRRKAFPGDPCLVRHAREHEAHPKGSSVFLQDQSFQAFLKKHFLVEISKIRFARNDDHCVDL